MSRIARHLITATAAAAVFAASAGAQLLPRVSVPLSLPGPVANAPVVGPVLNSVTNPAQVATVVRPTLDQVKGLPQGVAESGASALLDLRRLRLQALLRDYRSVLEDDGRGQPVRRGILIAVNPDPLSLEIARRAGFRAIAAYQEPVLGMRTVTLGVPRGKSAREALKQLSKLAPGLNADFDHIYEPAGGSLAPVNATLAAAAGAGRGRTIGMIDGGVASHPSLASAAIEQSGFAGPPKPTGHGTAVASLLVGNQGQFRGAASGAELLVADVYGGDRSAGSAVAIVRALAWLARHQPDVINISLVGPENKAVARAVQILQGRGIGIVAAVGNDGPAAPPQYPASYAGVVAATGVDSRGRALPEAGRAKDLDFAAPGADMAAALPGQGYTVVRGTSFAAPLVASRLASVRTAARLAAEARPGRGKVGRGIVCAHCRVDPKAVGAK